ncbi:hypothetical protein N7539_008874 [Penicillium diatomitis]|uniref:Uncharacterized protein n=1 Tax=Penicillium diatomitis TaxID=2819901 RepID=A0A9W9WKT6_9EURO|nr:uncharacterized protein N7539_008874 [Penicillium diatomitis]KAJ5469256.1 hypothetical protein N7539_008874 [Penicillium diatomitis]
MLRRSHRPTTTTTRETKPSLMTRLKGPGARTQTTKTKTTTTRHGHGHGHATTTGSGHRTSKRHVGTTQTAHHHKRKVTMGDKVSGAMTKLKGTLTGRPGVKAAGTRRMHGTDGRGSHHRTAY